MKTTTRLLVPLLLAGAVGCDVPPPATAPPGSPEPATDDSLSEAVAAQIPGRDLREHPPAVKEMKVFRAAAGARLEIRYEEALPAQLQLLYQGEPLLLRDDGQAPDRVAGDGVYSALVPMEALSDGDADPFAGALAKLPADGSAGLILPTDPRGRITDIALAAAPAVNDAATIKARSLMVTDVAVVNHPKYTADPCLSRSDSDAKKEWTIGYLLTQAANQSGSSKNPSPSDFATAWLESWADGATVNGDNVQPVDTNSTRQVGKETLRQWRCASGIGACCVQDGHEFFHEPAAIKACNDAAHERDSSGKTKRPLKMNKAPFRLNAIVNRLDLRHNLSFGAGKAGELRFVFGVLDLEQVEVRSGACTNMNMIRHDRGPSNPPVDIGPGFEGGLDTVIFEYQVKKSTSTDVKAWAKSWWSLKDVDPNATGTHKNDYVDKLHALTKTIVAAGKGSGANGSALIRIRTNDSPDDNTWQLREFAVAKGGHLPAEHTIANTPNHTYNDDSLTQDRLLGPWIDANEAAILKQQHKVPDLLPGDTLPFVGGETTHLESDGVWGLNVDDGFLICNNPEARRMFSLNTCSGCHGRETNTPFAHIVARNYLEPAELSGFLTGVNFFADQPFTVDDPGTGVPHAYHELDDRLADLAGVVGGSFVSALAFQPTGRTH